MSIMSAWDRLKKGLKTSLGKATIEELFEEAVKPYVADDFLFFVGQDGSDVVVDRPTQAWVSGYHKDGEYEIEKGYKGHQAKSFNTNCAETVKRATEAHFDIG